ncbi:MAG: diguanylate cyclase [Betaproteobacteria bacterium]
MHNASAVRTTITGCVLALVAIVALGYLAVDISRDEMEAADTVAHTGQVIVSVEAIRSAVLGAESAARTYLVTGGPDDVARYDALRPVVDTRIREFRELVADNPAQQQRSHELQEQIYRRFAELGTSVVLRRDGGLDAVLQRAAAQGNGQLDTKAIETQLIAMTAEEQRLLAERKEVRRHGVHRVWAGIGLIVAFSGAIVTWLSMRLLKAFRAIRAAVEHANHVAHHDELTDLPNRRMLMDKLSTALAAARRHHHGMAVLYMDLDGFKKINEELGQAVGDELLREIGRRVAATIRRDDTASRISGDEFVVGLLRIDQPQAALRAAEKLVAAVRQPVTVDGHTLSTTVSIGIAAYPEHGGTIEELMRYADEALYEAKMGGRNCYRNYVKVSSNVL